MVFVINHRSNMDYVLVTYLVSERSALSYAVGEWARVWALQSLIRAMGGYFVRRDLSGPLYRKVLARYVSWPRPRAWHGAVSRGGLTQRRAASHELGILGSMVSGFDPQGPRDVVFVQVGLNSDPVLEAASRPRRRHAAGRAAALRLQPAGPHQLPARPPVAAAARALVPLRLCLRRLVGPLSLRAPLAWPPRSTCAHRHERRQAEIGSWATP